jgi:hypothetical protein
MTLDGSEIFVQHEKLRLLSFLKISTQLTSKLKDLVIFSKSPQIRPKHKMIYKSLPKTP